VRNRPSRTAAWVAACRSFGVLLPERERLADDPYGARFAGTTALFRTPRLALALFPRRAVRYMQVRTRVIDDVMLDFVRGGGDQVVILGAGFDCRALRFAHELARATVFEVDHPATQAKKRAVLAPDVGARTEYVAWNFEEQPMRELGAALADQGHDARRPTLTIWEGVTMYLRPEAIDATLAAVRGFSAPGSRLVFNYMTRDRVEHPRLVDRVTASAAAVGGEPFRFGFDPGELRAWLAARGFRLDRDASMTELARELLPDAALPRALDRRVALATREED
jgi:methyltransferase (TIGR00027 family)